MRVHRLCQCLCLLQIAVLWGCSSMKPAESTLMTPFFVPTSEDASRLSVLTNQLDAKAVSCSEAASYERIHYGRGLVSLFENREAARGWFRRVIEHNPASPLAVTSQMWLRLIEKDEQVSEELRARLFLSVRLPLSMSENGLTTSCVSGQWPKTLVHLSRLMRRSLINRGFSCELSGSYENVSSRSRCFGLS